MGTKACLENRRVFFTSVPNSIIELNAAMSQCQIACLKKQFEKYNLVILDKLGCVSFDKEGSETLLNLLSYRINVGSVIITLSRHTLVDTKETYSHNHDRIK